MSHQKQPMAVVSGGSRGIGRALVDVFLRENIPVVTASRSQESLNMLQKDMQVAHPRGTLHTVAADLSAKAGIDALVKQVPLARDVTLILVHNVGTFLPGGIQSGASGVLERLLETNLYSAYFLTRALLPHMLREKDGHIFTICSTASIKAYPQGGAYCISKFALLGFSKVLREELKESNIRVTAVLPGATLTASWQGTTLPSSRFMPAEDVAEAVWNAYGLSSRTNVEELVMRPQLGDI